MLGSGGPHPIVSHFYDPMAMGLNNASGFSTFSHGILDDGSMYASDSDTDDNTDEESPSDELVILQPVKKVTFGKYQPFLGIYL